MKKSRIIFHKTVLSNIGAMDDEVDMFINRHGGKCLLQLSLLPSGYAANTTGINLEFVAFTLNIKDLNNNIIFQHPVMLNWTRLTDVICVDVGQFIGKVDAVASGSTAWNGGFRVAYSVTVFD